MMQDLEEAMRTFIHMDVMRNAGIDEAFAEQFARNAMNFDKLPPGTQQRIAEQFTGLAYGLSMQQTVARKHDEARWEALAGWFKSVNLLLANPMNLTRREPEQ